MTRPVPLIERDALLTGLSRAIADAADGAGTLVFLGGDAGVGKTSLTLRLAADSATRLRTLRGEIDNVTTAEGLGALIDAMPELEAVAADQTGARRLALFKRVRSLLATEPTLLVLEDVQWADEATLEFLRFLGRRVHDMPLACIATYRYEDVSARHGLSVVMGELATAPAVSRITVPPLTEAGVRALVATAGSSADPATLYERTGGNAFFVSEILAADDEQIPPTIRDAVLARVHRLSPGARSVLNAAAVLVHRAPTALLIAVANEAAGSVDECVQHGMLVSDGDGWAFRHDLARLAVAQTIGIEARTALHARALRALGESSPVEHRALAYHAAGCGDREALRQHASQAAARAARLGAHREAMTHYRMALGVPNLPAAERTGLLDALSYECYLTDHLEDALTARREALDLLMLAGDAVAVGSAQRWLARLSWFVGRNGDAESYAQRAVATLQPLGDSHELAMAYSTMAQLRMAGYDAAGAVEWGRRATGLARRIGDRETEMHALNSMGTVLSFETDSVEGRHRLAQSLDLALIDDAHEHAARAYCNLASVAVAAYRLRDADQHLRAGMAYCDERDLDSWGRYMAARLAVSMEKQGEYAAADQLATQLLAIPHLAAVTRIHALVVAAALSARRGGDATALLARASELALPTGEAQRIFPVATARAEAAWLTGRREDIGAEIDVAWPSTIAHPSAWTLGELCWWLWLGGSDRPAPGPIAAPFRLMLEHRWHPAADAWTELGCPLWAALALGFAPDLDAARRALDIVDGLGAPAVREAIVRERRIRALPLPRQPRAATRGNPGGLTVRELEVLELLADGLSNAQIAASLVVSPKTVDHHVSAVLRKLGQPGRHAAVEIARRDGILATAASAPAP